MCKVVLVVGFIVALAAMGLSVYNTLQIMNTTMEDLLCDACVDAGLPDDVCEAICNLSLEDLID